MRLPLIAGCLVLSACAATPPAPVAKSGDAAAKPVQVCDGEQPSTGSILSKRRCHKREQPRAEREAAQDAHGKADQSGGS